MSVTYEWMPEGDKGWTAEVVGGELRADDTSYGIELGHNMGPGTRGYPMRAVTRIVDIEFSRPAKSLSDAMFKAQRYYERHLVAMQVAIDDDNLRVVIP